MYLYSAVNKSAFCAVSESKKDKAHTEDIITNYILFRRKDKEKDNVLTNVWWWMLLNVHNSVSSYNRIAAAFLLI